MNDETICAPAAITPAVFDAAITSYTHITSSLWLLNDIINKEHAKIDEQHAPQLHTLLAQRHEAFEQIKTYCLQQKKNLFAKRRSIRTAAGMVGFRLGTPKLRPMYGTTWANILPLLKEKMPRYVRVTEEPAKDLLLSHRHTTEVASQLQSLGLQVVQDEVFYIEPLKEKTST